MNGKILVSSMMLMTMLFIPPLSLAMVYEIHPQAPSILQKLEKASGGTLKMEWNEETNTPYSLNGTLSLPSRHSPEWIAYGFLKRTKSLYGLRNPIRDMKVMEVERGRDRIMVHFQHLLFNTPVWGDWLAIEMDGNGVIRRVEGILSPHLDKRLLNRPMHAALTKKQAIAKARAIIQSEISNEPEAERYYLPTRPGIPLIYVVRFRLSDQETMVFVHSLTGRVIEQYKK